MLSRWQHQHPAGRRSLRDPLLASSHALGLLQRIPGVQTRFRVLFHPKENKERGGKSPFLLSEQGTGSNCNVIAFTVCSCQRSVAAHCEDGGWQRTCSFASCACVLGEFFAPVLTYSGGGKEHGSGCLSPIELPPG